jgi:hypothetical protein
MMLEPIAPFPHTPIEASQSAIGLDWAIAPKIKESKYQPEIESHIH